TFFEDGGPATSDPQTPLGPTRFSGRSTRSGECTRSAYARTLPQITPCVNGCSGLPRTSVIRPLAVVTISEHADGQSCGHTDSIVSVRYHARVSVLARLHALHPFKSRDAQRLAMLFGVVYFSQGMYYVFGQPLTLTLKERLGLTPTQVATFGWITLLPWVIKPLYGILSDSVPLFGFRRKSYFLLTCALATAAGLLLAAQPTPTYWTLAAFVTLMALGVAFTDVLTDAMMVESGKPLGLTGAFQ